MANVLKHAFQSVKADGPDATQVQPSHWNAPHSFAGGVDGQILTRDAAEPDGAKWTTPATGGGGLPAGGTDGQLLAKDAAEPTGAEWITPPPGNVPGGADGQILTRDSADPLGAKWTTPTAGGGGSLDEILASTSIGTINDWAPGLAGKHATIIWTGASAATVNGLAGGVAGQRVTVKNRAGGPVMVFAPSAAGSAAANRFTLPVTSAPTPVADHGWITFLYQTGIGWILVDHGQGAWITPAFNASDYTANPGSWTVDAGDVTTFAYMVVGRALFINFYLVSTTVAGSPAELRRAIPGGFTAGQQGIGFTRVRDAGASAIMGVWGVSAGQTYLYFNAGFTGGFTNGTNSTQVGGMAIIEIS